MTLRQLLIDLISKGVGLDDEIEMRPMEKHERIIFEWASSDEGKAAIAKVIKEETAGKDSGEQEVTDRPQPEFVEPDYQALKQVAEFSETTANYQPDLDAKIAELRRRLAEATPAPWEISRDGTGRTQEIVAIVHPRPDLEERYPSGEYGEAFRQDQICLGHCMSEADAATIIQARNHLPTILDALEAAQGENARLKRGNFTPEEFQALCHHLDEKTECQAECFYDGCHEYQRKLFGHSERDLVESMKSGFSERVRDLELEITRLRAELAKGRDA